MHFMSRLEYDPNKGHILKKYSCNQVRTLQEDWKKDYRRTNHTDELIAKGSRDRSYESYCKSISNFLNKCDCKVKT